MAPFGLEVVTEQLGITGDELREELAAGKSIADVAVEKGVDPKTLIDAIVEENTSTIEERVTAFVMGTDN